MDKDKKLSARKKKMPSVRLPHPMPMPMPIPPPPHSVHSYSYYLSNSTYIDEKNI